MRVNSSTIYDSEKVETAHTSTNRWTDKPCDICTVKFFFSPKKGWRIDARRDANEQQKRDADPERLCIVCERPRIHKSTEKASFRGDKNVAGGGGCTTCDCTKCHWIVCLKMLNVMFCALCLNKNFFFFFWDLCSSFISKTNISCLSEQFAWLLWASVFPFTWGPGNTDLPVASQ